MPFFARTAKLSSVTDPQAPNAEFDSTDQRCSLDRLRSGERGCVCASSLTPSDRSLLESMGLSIGCLIEVCRGGRSCVVKVGRTRIALARELAAAVEVRRVA